MGTSQLQGLRENKQHEQASSMEKLQTISVTASENFPLDSTTAARAADRSSDVGRHESERAAMHRVVATEIQAPDGRDREESFTSCHLYIQLKLAPN